MLTSTLANLALLAATVALVWTVVQERVAGRVPIASLARRWFSVGKTTTTTVAVAIVAGVLLVAVPLVLVASSNGVSDTADHSVRPAVFLLASLATILAKAAFVAFEEVAFRGALLGHLETRIGAPAAVIVSALVFGLAHAARASEASDALAVATTFVDGIGYGAAAVTTGSLWTPIAWHLAKNVAVWQLTGTSTLQFAPGLGAFGEGTTNITDVLTTVVIVGLAVSLLKLVTARHD